MTAVYNYSDITLTDGMTKLLNRGLNFCVTPEKLNITQLLTEIGRFERKTLWKEHWHGRKDVEEEYIPPLFPKASVGSAPKGSKTVRTFISSVRSDILGTKLNKIRSNITEEEEVALKELIDLQKRCQIVIKPCDKGAGIIICDYVKYWQSCTEHLKSKAANNESHYKEVDVKFLEEAKKKILKK